MNNTITHITKKWFRRVLLTSCCLLFIFFNVLAQSGNFKVYKQDEGLNEFIYTIAQDSQGYLWVGTGNGIFRFDGKVFKNYLNPKTSKNSFVTSSITDKNQQLWVGHYNGKVSKYLIDEDKFVELEMLKPYQSNINQLVQGKGNYIWIVSQSNGIARINDDGSQAFYVTEEPMIIYTMAEINDDEILLGTSEGLFLCELKEGKIITTFHHPYFKESKINDIQPNKFGEGYLICTEEDGLFFYKSSQLVEQLSITEGLPSKNIKTICQKSPTELWVATADKGLALLDPTMSKENKVQRLFNKSTGTKDNYITAIFLDQEENIWIGSYGWGLWEYRGEFFTFYNDNQFIRVFSTCQSSPNNYWLGTESGIIQLNIARNVEHYIYLGNRHPLAEMKVNTLFTDKQGMLWVGTDGDGAYLINPEKPHKVEHLNKRQDFDGKKIKSISIDPNGNIWLSTTLRGVFKYVVGEDRFYNYSTRSPLRTNNSQHFPDNIQNVLADSKGRVWVIAPGFGVGYFKEGDLQLLRDESITNMEFYCIAEDSNGDIWIGTEGFGAFRYDGRQFQQLTTSEGLLSNYVRSIGCDTLGNVWFGSSNGIAKYDLKNNILRTFGKSEGLEDLEIQPSSFYKDKQENIWFGTNQGALRYDPAKDNYNELPPNTIITSFLMNDKKVPISEAMSFSYKRYKLRFEFAGISLKEPERIEYEYFLEGFDDEWRKSKERFATYPKIDDGDYVFKVRAANSDGLWNEEPLEISFTIKKPIWEEVWFYVLVILIVGGAIYAYNHARLLRYRKANQLLEEKVDQRTQELQQQTNKLAKANAQLDEKNHEIEAAYQKLVSLEEFKDKMTGMIVHDMKNPLNSIIALSRESNPAVEQSGKQMLQMVMNILDIQKFEDTQVQLNLGEYQLVEVIDEAVEQVTFLVKQKGQSISNEISPSYRGNFDYNIILRVLVNLLTNAIKYSPPSGKIRIHAQVVQPSEKEFLEISVTDSGEGIPAEHVPYVFDKFYQAKAKSSGSVRSTGLGLTFCKMVIEAHGGEIGVESVMKEGSTFHFSVPRISDADVESTKNHQPTSVEEEKLILSDDSKAYLTEISAKFASLDIYETSKNLSILNSVEANGNSEIANWKEEMENAIFSFNDDKYQILLQLPLT